MDSVMWQFNSPEPGDYPVHGHYYATKPKSLTLQTLYNEAPPYFRLKKLKIAKFWHLSCILGEERI
jgi:hypothetical protein